MQNGRLSPFAACSPLGNPRLLAQWVTALLVACLCWGWAISAPAAVLVLENTTGQPVDVELGPVWGGVQQFSLPADHPYRVAVPGVVSLQVAREGDARLVETEPNRIYRIAIRGDRLQVEPQQFLGARPNVWLHADDAERPPQPVIVPVKLLVDDEQPARIEAWESRLRAQLAGASRFIEWYSGVRFEVVGVGTWESNDALEDPAALDEDFCHRAPLGDARLAIGVSSQWRLSKPPLVPDVPRDPLFTHCVIPDAQEGFSSQDQLRVLVHCLGRFLGAAPSDDEASVMYPIDRAPPEREDGAAAAPRAAVPPRFDAENTLVMSLVAEEMRHVPLRGPADLSRGTRDYLRAVYLELARATNAKELRRLAEVMSTPPAAAQRYLAVWTDGTTTSGDEIIGWTGDNPRPSLAGRPLFVDPPVRAIFDTADEAKRPEAFVEFRGGDCLPGRVVASFPAQQVDQEFLPNWFEVTPYVHLDAPDGPSRPRLKVAASWVRRIVWRPVADRYQPGTLFTADGRELSFRSAKITPGSVRLLRDEGIEDYPWLDVAELHLRNDADDAGWEACFDARAVLAPQGRANVVELETDEGLRATISSSRLAVRGDSGKPDDWRFLVQPPWSLQGLWIPHREVRWWRFFDPHEVPLWRIQPSFEEKPVLGGPWGYQVNRNIFGRMLESGSRPYAWGFGVQSASRLRFHLPQQVVAFQTALGLDQLANDGGCVRATIWAASPSGQRQRAIFQSPLLLGSSRVLKTGRLTVESPGELVLEVDPAEEDCPPGADPGNIRDTFDWLEPLVLLDPQQLAERNRQVVPQLIAAWDGWQVEPDEGAPPLAVVNRLDETERREPRYRLLAAHGRGPWALRRTIRLPEDADALEVWACRPAGAATVEIDVFIDEEKIDTITLHERGGTRFPGPPAVSLEDYAGHEVDVRLVIRGESDEAATEWRAVRVTRAVKEVGADSVEP